MDKTSLMVVSAATGVYAFSKSKPWVWWLPQMTQRARYSVMVWSLSVLRENTHLPGRTREPLPGRGTKVHAGRGRSYVI